MSTSAFTTVNQKFRLLEELQRGDRGFRLGDEGEVDIALGARRSGESQYALYCCPAQCRINSKVTDAISSPAALSDAILFGNEGDAHALHSAVVDSGHANVVIMFRARVGLSGGVCLDVDHSTIEVHKVEPSVADVLCHKEGTSLTRELLDRYQPAQAQVPQPAAVAV